MKKDENLIKLRKEIDESIKKLDYALEKGNNKWIEKDAVEILAKVAILAKNANNSQRPSIYLD
jgi:hypothetical protein